VYHVKNTPIVTDSSSNYINNAAIKGGVIYSDLSSLTLNSVTITNSYANQGAIFYSYDQSPLHVSSSTFLNSYAYDKAAVGYFE
jgi:hypothetical protein